MRNWTLGWNQTCPTLLKEENLGIEGSVHYWCSICIIMVGDPFIMQYEVNYVTWNILCPSIFNSNLLKLFLFVGNKGNKGTNFMSLESDQLNQGKEWQLDKGRDRMETFPSIFFPLYFFFIEPYNLLFTKKTELKSQILNSRLDILSYHVK